MKVLIRNKFFSLTGSSKVLNENKEPLYNVKGKFLSIRKKKRVCDLDGKVLFKVQNKFFNLFSHSAFILDADGKRVARVTRKLFDVKGNYVVEDCEDEILVEGKFFGLSSKIIKNGAQVGSITRDVTLFEDHFTLEGEPQDIPFLIALVIAIDNISDKKSKQAK